MPGVDLVLNPHARRLRPGSARRRIVVDEAGREGVRIHEPTTLAELEEVARGCALRGVRVVLVAGGDGTLMRCLSALVGAFEPASLPLVGIVPAGTVDTVSRNLGVARARIRTIVRAACSVTATGSPQSTLCVRDGAEAGRIGFIFGAGLVSQFFDLYHRSRRPGLATAAIIAARVFTSSLVGTSLAARVLAPAACVLSVDGLRREETGWSLVVASVVCDLGLHFRVTYRARSDGPCFHVVASGLSPYELGRQMPRVLAGRPLRGQPHVDALATSLRLDFKAPGAAYVLDGDVFQASSLTVETGPAVRMLRIG
ncbi:MAG TPA: diacylglycerol kinase family protein [Polyangiaceae bacterium]|nr:diacylglycerol kinase family protein [Polyangiaceae bacterium]